MTQKLDPGKLNHSPSSDLMTLVDIEHMSDFNDVVEFLKLHLNDIIQEVHGFDKLMLDNGKVLLNVPPAPESGDNHGAELLRTLSEKHDDAHNVTLKREFKVHDVGATSNGMLRKVEIREDVVQAPSEIGQPPVYKENVATIEIQRNSD